MKINIQKREPDKNDLSHQAGLLLPLKAPEKRFRIPEQSYKPLNLYLYNKPQNTIERKRNKTTRQSLLELESAKYGLNDCTKLDASFLTTSGKLQHGRFS